MDLLDRAFDRPEGWLGRIGGWLMAHRNRDTIAWVVGLLDVAPRHRVLEVGFGPGVGVEQVLEEEPRAEVCGVDPSGPMLEAARERNSEAVEAGDVELRHGVAEELPWPDRSFDRAFSVDTYQAWRDPAAALTELHRVLDDDGRLALGFTEGKAEHAEGLTDELTRAGFHRARRMTGEAGVCVIAER